MKAMIFAAGLGTRLKPLTNNTPKALVEINNKTLLEYALEKIAKAGIKDVVINVHYFAEKIYKFIDDKDFGNLNISISDESEQLLNTGGGLKKAQCFFNTDEDILVYNVDIISSIDLKDLLKKHTEENALATLAVSRRKTSRYLLFNSKDRLCAWENRNSGETKIVHSDSLLTPLAFSGIQVVSPKIFPMLTEDGAFSIIDAYLRLAKESKIIGYDHTGDVWVDIGKINELDTAKEIVCELYN